MKFTKAFVTPALAAIMSVLSAATFGAVSNTPEAYAPNVQMIEIIEQEKIADDLALGIVDGMTKVERAAKIDAYFGQYNLPLAGHGMTFVHEADKYDQVDWRLLAAIAMKESTGGSFEFAPNNFAGWGNKVAFPTRDIAIARITEHLAGENESTAHHYAGQDTEGILAKYNSVIPTYTAEIFAIMEDIENMPIEEATILVFNDQ